LEILSDYYALLGMHDDMIRFMKDSLLICTKFWGPDAEHTGIKQYELADRYLKANRKKDAMEYFLKAKDNIQHNKTKTNKLGLTHLKLASIYLSDLEYEKAASFAKDSINIFEDYERKIKSHGLYNEPYKIKAY
jgi:tetratricopeptide (TPR) repeat protein